MRVAHYTTMAAGDETDILVIDSVTSISGGVAVSFHMRDTIYAQYVSLWVDGVQCGRPIFTSTSTVTLFGVHDSALTLHRICIVPQGDWPTPNDFGAFIFSDFFSQCKNQIRATITPALEFIPDSTLPLSSISLTGFQRFANCNPVTNNPNWAVVYATLSDSAGTRTLTLYSNGIAIATGSRVGDGSITLSEQNSSGVSGSASVVYTSTVTEQELFIRFPSSYQLHYKTSAFISGDFPRTPEITASDDGKSITTIATSPQLVSGTYYVVTKQVDENENASTNIDSGGVAITITDQPASPTALAYSSGGYAATVVSFTASTTAGATYNIYDSGDTDFLDIGVIAVTHIAGTGTLTQTLPAIDSGYTGVRRVLVRAVNAGVEDANAEILNIEYSSGVAILPRPNNPSYTQPIAVNGKTISVNVSYRTASQKVAPANFAIFVWLDGAAQSFTMPSATQSVGTLSGGFYTATISFTVPVNGLYYFGLRAISSAGTHSDSTQIFGPIELTTSVPSAPNTVVIEGV